MELKRFESADIEIGKPLSQDAFDENGGLVLQKGHVIETEEQLKAHLERGLFHRQAAPAALETGSTQEQITTLTPFELLDDAQVRLAHLFDDITASCTIEERHVNEITGLCKTLQEACNEDMDAAISYLIMRNAARYTVKHPVHNAIICELMTRNLKWNDQDRLSLLAAVMTSNIGMIELQEDLYRQGKSLSREQSTEIHKHPEKAVEILAKAGIRDRLWLDSVLHHHETLDGRGYPHMLKGETVPLPSQIIKIGDIYCAKTTERAYRTPLLPDKAIRVIFLSRGRDIEASIAEMFVKLIGLYPPGTIVRLVNGEIAIVIRRGEKAHCPIVRSIIRLNGEAHHLPLWRDCSNNEYAIKEAVYPDKRMVKLNKHLLWGYVDADPAIK
ncbi:MAG: HD domain-containing protein [Nitrospirae bacterium]|nr:HD domain-containing protein [Nitrospirota bacterium]